MINKLVKLANDLDAGGYPHLADVVDEILSKMGQEDLTDRLDSYQTPDNTELGKVDTTPGPMPDTSHIGAKPGAIKPPGDPYTYDYIAAGDYFLVRTAPQNGFGSIGAKIPKGHPAYVKLQPYIPNAGPVANAVKPDRAAIYAAELGDIRDNGLKGTYGKFIQSGFNSSVGRGLGIPEERRMIEKYKTIVDPYADPNTLLMEAISVAESASTKGEDSGANLMLDHLHAAIQKRFM